MQCAGAGQPRGRWGVIWTIYSMQVSAARSFALNDIHRVSIHGSQPGKVVGTNQPALTEVGAVERYFGAYSPHTSLTLVDDLFSACEVIHTGRPLEVIICVPYWAAALEEIAVAFSATSGRLAGLMNPPVPVLACGVEQREEMESANKMSRHADLQLHRRNIAQPIIYTHSSDLLRASRVLKKSRRCLHR